MTSKLKTDVLETGSGSGTIALNNQLSGMTAASMPSGSVVQVVNGTTNIQTGSATTTYATTGLTATITPTSTSSKILVLANQSGVYKNGTNNGGVDLQLIGGGVLLAQMASRAAGDSGTVSSAGSVSMSYLDSPASIAAETYHTEFRANSNSGYAYVQIYSSVSTITLIEIKG